MQGQSDYTWFKQYRWSPIFAQSLNISKAVSVARFPYYHIDLNSGGGWNLEANVEGSPLNFLAAVTRTGRQNFHAFFVDQDINCIRELGQRPEIQAKAARITLHRGDNSEILPTVHEFIVRSEPHPYFAVGSLVVDPNGYHEGVPWEALQSFCRAHPRIDVLMNLNSRTFRMEWSHIKRGVHRGWRQKMPHPPSTFPQWFSRPHWMITRECTIGGNHWIQLVGRTMRTQTPGYRSLGFYDWHSDDARETVSALEATRAPRELPLLREL